jgi:hypothetical protein
MTKLKDIVIAHNVKVRELQQTALDDIATARKAARSLPKLKAQIDTALDTLAQAKEQTESQYRQEINEHARSR